MAKVLLYHPRPFFRSRRDPGTAGRLPHHLLDGAIHDRRPLDSEQGALAVPVLEGRARQVQQLPDLHPQLPHEPGRQSDGAAGRHGELKIATDKEIHDRAFIRERRLIRAVQFLVSKGNWVSRAAVNRRCWGENRQCWARKQSSGSTRRELNNPGRPIVYFSIRGALVTCPGRRAATRADARSLPRRPTFRPVPGDRARDSRERRGQNYP